MRAVVADTIDAASLLLTPSDQLGCSGLLRSIVHPGYFSFSDKHDPLVRSVLVAEFVFDEVVLPKYDNLEEFDQNINHTVIDKIYQRVVSDPRVDHGQQVWFQSQDELGTSFEKCLPDVLRDGCMLEKNTIVLSSDPLINRIATTRMTPTSDVDMIARLASAGIAFAMPNIDAVDLDEIREFRDSHRDLRQEYLNHWRKIIRLFRVTEDDGGAIAELLKSRLRDELWKIDEICGQIERAAMATHAARTQKLRMVPVSEGVPGLFGSVMDLFVSGSFKPLTEHMASEAIRLYKAWNMPNRELETLRTHNPAATYIFEARKLEREQR